MKIKHAISALLAVYFVMYLSYSLIVWDLNWPAKIEQWTNKDRGALLLLGLFPMVLIAMIQYFSTFEIKDKPDDTP